MSEVSYSTLADYVSHRRPQIAQQARGDPPDAYIRQSYRPGVEAEVDFGDVWIDLDGSHTKCYLFILRLSYSGKAVHRVFLCSSQAILQANDRSRHAGSPKG